MRRMAADYQRGRIRVTAAWALLIGVAASLLIQAAANAWLLAQRPMIEARLAEATGAPARIGEARIVWQGFRPLLALRDVRLLMSETGGAKLRVEGARLGAAPAGLLQGVLRLNRLELAGSELRLQEDESGWRLGGGGAGGGGFDPVALQRLAARFEAITVRDFEISARPLHSALPVSAHLDEASLRPESGGWRLRATLHDAERSGRLTATGVVSGDAAEPDSWRHNWRLAFDGSHDFAHSLGRLYPDAPLARIEGGRLRGELRSQGRGEEGSWMLSLDARAARIYGAGEDRLEDLHAVLSAHLDDERLDIAFQRLTLGGTSQSEGLRLSYRPADGSGRLRARRLELGVVSPLLRAVGGERLPRLEGALRRLRLGWGGEAPALERIEASLEKVALEGESYRVAGLSGHISGDGAAGRLQLEEGPLTLALDAHLFTPLRMDRAAGALAWRVAAGGGRVLRFEELALSLDSLHARGGGSLRLPPQDAPELELDMALSARDVEDAKPFMPRAWKPELRDYLAQAVKGARVPEGRLRLAAALTPDFMRQPETELGIDLDVEDAAVRFHPEWPSAQGISGSVAIDASGLAVHAERAGMAGLQLRDVRVGIADFREAVLRAEASHRAALDDWYAMLRASPLAERLAGLTERTRGRGDAELDFALTLPLKNRPATKAEGSVTLDGAELEVAAIDASFRDIRGRVHFVNEAVAAEVLEARLHGRSVSARLDTRDGVPHLMVESRVDLGNPEGLARLLPGWLQPRLSGDVPLSMDLTLAPVDGFNRLVLSLDSRGLTVDLPPPLDLRPDPVRDPIRVDASLDEGRIARMALRLPGRLALRLDGPRTQLHLGPGRVPEGQGEGLHVSGHADTLALPAWMALGRRIEAAVAAGDGGGLAGPVGSAGLQGVDLTTDALRIGAFAIPDVALRLARNGDGQRLWVDGASRGELQIGGGPRTHLTGRFERLRLRRAREDAADEAPFDDGERDADTLMREALDPAQLPSADLLVTDLLLDDLRLGQLDMRLEPTEGGLRLSRLRLSDGALDLEASGLWRRPEAVSDAATRMQLEAELRTDRIDALLSALGFARTLVAEDFRASARLRWSEMEWLVQLAGAEGELSVEATDGRLAAVEPGAGRMLGLFNFFALPRRLGLDFRDVTDGGLAFDRLGGSFRLGGGNAFTEDLSLEGPSLRVEVRGRVGLAARDYDQRIRIYPDLSGGMTIGGAVLGGPIGVGIALLARELFETPIEAATRIDYRLVGDWSDPRIIPENIATTGDRERPR
jgi:uncharacterized protein (TIGR02099 family)